jgi:CHASE1-domain containing sensor protein
MSAIRPGRPAWWERILGIGRNVGYRWPGIVRTVLILACLVGLGIAAYCQVEHLVLRAQLREMNRKLNALEQKLDEYESVAGFLNDSASARILESLMAQTPAPAESGESK